MRKCQDWARTHSNLCANFTCFCQNKVWKNILAPWLDRLATWRDISGFPAAARKSWCVEQLFSFLPHVLKPEMQLSSVSKHTKFMPNSWSFCSGCARLRSLPICHYWLLIQCRKLEVKRELQDRKGVPTKKKSDKQELSLPNPSPYSFSNYPPLHGVTNILHNLPNLDPAQWGFSFSLLCTLNVWICIPTVSTIYWH